MSSPIANVEIVAQTEPMTNVEIVAQKAPRVKKPSLPAKYNKFMSFGFWFLNKMDPTVRDQLFPELKLFSTIEDQSAFIQTYLDEASASNKIMRKTVTAFHKPPKVRAEKKSRKSSKPVAAESDDLIAKLIADANGSTEPAAEASEAPVQEKPKKSRKSTKKVEEPVATTTTTSDVVATEAPVQEKPKKTTKKAEEPTTTTTTPAPVEEPTTTTPAPEPVQEKPKKSTKKSTKKTEEPITATDAPVQEKPKKATKKSTKKVEEPVVAQPAESVQDEDDDSDEIQTRIVTIDGGKQYLIDSEHNLYDITSHEQIGKFDPETNQPILS